MNGKTYNTQAEADDAIRAWVDEQEAKRAAEKAKQLQAEKDYNNSPVGVVSAIGSLLVLVFFLLVIWHTFKKKS
jgi:hypothetical protein